MTRFGRAKRKEQRGRIVARNGVKKIYLNLRQIVETVIENPAKLFQEARRGNLFGGVAVQVGGVGNLLLAAKLLKGLQ